MGVNIVSFLLYKEPVLDEKWLFRGINIMIWSAIAHYVYHVLNEMKTILGINIFTVTPKVANPQESGSPSTPIRVRGKMGQPSDLSLIHI